MKEDARKLLAVPAGKEGVQEGRPVPAGPGDAVAAGIGAGASGERLHRAVWHLIAEGALEAALVGARPTGGGCRAGTGAVYRITRTG